MAFEDVKVKRKKTLIGVYIVEFENGVKVGMSEDIPRRLLAYKSPWCIPIKDIKTIKCAGVREALKLEKFVLSLFTHKIGEFIPGATALEVLEVMVPKL